MNQKNINKILKNNWEIIINKYLLKTVLWTILTVSLIIFALILKIHPDWKELILKWDFFNNSMNFINPIFTAQIITLIETYLYMAILGSVIANIGLILIQIKVIRQRYIETKYQIFSNINNNSFIFKNLLLVDISRNITYIFCFTNAITFVFVLFYFLIYFIIDNILDKNFKFTKEQVRTKWWENTNQKSTFTVLTIEVGYFLLKNTLKSSIINIDFDQILKYFIPASSLALIIGVFVQSLVKNNVKKILNNMSNVRTKANDFNIFYKLESKNVLANYEFIKTMPIILKKKVHESNANKEEILKLVDQISQLIDTLESKKKSKQIKDNELNYLMYHIFYETKSEAELKQISKKILVKRKGD